MRGCRERSSEKRETPGGGSAGKDDAIIGHVADICLV